MKEFSSTLQVFSPWLKRDIVVGSFWKELPLPRNQKGQDKVLTLPGFMGRAKGMRIRGGFWRERMGSLNFFQIMLNCDSNMCKVVLNVKDICQLQVLSCLCHLLLYVRKGFSIVI